MARSWIIGYKMGLVFTLFHVQPNCIAAVDGHPLPTQHTHGGHPTLPEESIKTIKIN